MQSHALKKIIWAVDVHGDEETQRQALKMLRPILAATHAKLQPVYVMSRDPLNPWAGEREERVRQLLTGLCSSTELPETQRPELVFDRGASIRTSVAELVEYARAGNADLIVASTHARSGISRFLMGSFVETLLLHSNVPVLTIRPEAAVPKTLSTVLFPTDFGQASRRGFEATVATCATLGAKLLLYFKAMQPPVAAFPEAPNFYAYSEEDEKERQFRASAWAEWATSRGISVETFVDERPGNAGQSIVDLAKERGIDLISMVAQSGTISSVLLGSVTRQVVRHAECPVWVQHSKG